MSDAIAGPRAHGPWSSVQPPPRDAAVVILWRPGERERGRELFWLRRGAKLAFGGGMYAFPGGKLDPEDAAVPIEGATGADGALRVCAARELFEETGVLLAEGTMRLGGEELARLRRGLLAGKLGFGELLGSRSLRLRASDLTPAGRWITPSFLPAGFDARLFLARLPEGQAAAISLGEASEGAFIEPGAALALWRAGEALLHPPNLNALRAMAEPALEDALARLLEPPFVQNFHAERIEFQEGIVLVPLRTPTLPPATHTNCYLAGIEEFAIVDPGAADPTELGVLWKSCRLLAAEGRRPRAIVLTHHHQDHLGGAAATARELGLPVWAHPLTAERSGLPCERLLHDGDELGLKGFSLRVLHTPGHTRGHLVLHHPPSGAVLAGDMVSGVSTIVIDPPEGNMASYLASLRRLGELPAKTLYPAHGPPLADGPGKLREYLDHRLAREGAILEALDGGATTSGEIVERVYQETPPSLHPLAERSVQAHLEKLAAEGWAQESAGRWLSLTRGPREG